MEWINSVEFNSTLPGEVWEKLVDKFQEQSAVWGKVFFDKVVLPVGQSLLYHTELAVQYTLNGDYEVDYFENVDLIAFLSAGCSRSYQNLSCSNSFLA